MKNLLYCFDGELVHSVYSGSVIADHGGTEVGATLVIVIVLPVDSCEVRDISPPHEI